MKNRVEKILTIESLGHHGDGLARLDQKMIAVPYTLPGEEVRVEIVDNGQTRANLLDIIKASPLRIPPSCPYFTVCGGCSLQHLDQESYRIFKANKIIGALNQQGFQNITMNSIVHIPPNSRRRVSLKAHKTKSTVLLGYYKRESHDIVSIQSCPLVTSSIETLITPLKSFCQKFLYKQEKAEILITDTQSGLDLIFKFKAFRELELHEREMLVEFARSQNLARLSIKSEDAQETVVCFRQPQVSFDQVMVDVEADSFLQVSELIDETLATIIQTEIQSPCKRAADLFCGRGTLSLPLARFCPVDAYEMDPKALIALRKAIQASKRPIHIFERNLFTNPLKEKELSVYDCVVLDPPRVGAFSQCKVLAKSNVPLVIMVSCNPASFARDARELVLGGYQMGPITPLDQFLWSSHIELTASFRK